MHYGDRGRDSGGYSDRGSRGGGYGGGGGGYGGGGMKDRRDAKRRRETDQFFSYQQQVSGKGGDRGDRFWQREENELFGGTKMSAGINFGNYDSIDVERRGGNGNEEVYENFGEICSQFTISEDLKENILEKCKYDNPTPVQKHAIPAGLAGTDVMVSAQTGSGKTAAFLIPMIAKTLGAGMSAPDGGPVKPLGVVLAPTRELCQQIAVEARKLCFRTQASPVSIYGGADALPQLKAMAEGCDIAICTPGRLDDFLERGVISMEHVKYLCLDEADRMLDMGFEPQIRAIVEGYKMPRDRQTMMFSATLPKEMQELAMDFLDPSYLGISVGKVGEASANIEQKFLDATRADWEGKFELLLGAVDSVQGDGGDGAKTLVFANKKADVDEVCMKLTNSKIRALAIHGGLSQPQRERALNKFRQGAVQVLVATDVAARGLDLPGINHVINYELPLNAEDYTHRIGRTGRIGNTGVATSFISDNEPALKDIVSSLKSTDAEIPEWLSAQGRYSGGSKRNYKGGGYGRDRGGYGGYNDRGGYGGNNNRGGDSYKGRSSRSWGDDDDDDDDGGYGSGRSSGGYGRDRSSGGYGRDRSSGGYGSDRSSGGYGSDRSSGGYGRDRSSGGYGGRDRSSGGYGQKRSLGGYSRDSDSSGGYDRGRGGGSRSYGSDDDAGYDPYASSDSGSSRGSDTPPWAKGLPPRQKAY